MSFVYVDTKEKLSDAVQEWKKEPVLGIDLECENNLHHYGVYISIIQVSSRKKNWIIDVLKLKNIKPLVKILHDKKIQKIFHDVNFDLRVINCELKCQPRNVFDTQIAANFLNKQLGLADLLNEYFDVKPEKKFQMADWTKRPLKKEQLIYAMGDTKYLIALRDKLQAELEKKGIFSWVEQEFKNLEREYFCLTNNYFLDLKGIKDLEPVELKRLKRLYFLREELAKRIDKPPYYVISNKLILEFAKEPPKFENWKQMKGVHSLVRREAKNFSIAIKKAKFDKPIVFNGSQSFSEKEKELVKKLTVIRNELGKKLEIKPHLLMDKEQIHSIVVRKNLNSLRKWQQTILLTHDLVQKFK